MNDKKILLISTGGTIACTDTGAGCSPVSPDFSLGGLLSAVPDGIDVDVTVPFFIDSIDMKPAHWQQLANIIFENYSAYDGFLITHGTDTMQYAAAALHYMLKNLGKPVVLTGSQLPLFAEGTDGYANFADGIKLAASGKIGVWIAFGGRVISGISAYKCHSRDLDAFRGTAHSVAMPDAPLRLDDAFGGNVFLLKLTPNLKPDILDYIKNANYTGLVLEGFGLGGIPSDFLPALAELIKTGVRVIYVSACAEGGADLGVYSIGVKAKEIGVEDGKDLTPSAAVIKLMIEIPPSER